jgi:hypothetical protein
MLLAGTVLPQGSIRQKRVRAVLLFLLFVGLVACWFVAPSIGRALGQDHLFRREVFALGAALVFPSWGLISLQKSSFYPAALSTPNKSLLASKAATEDSAVYGWPSTVQPPSHPLPPPPSAPPPPAWRLGVQALLQCSLLTLCGALIVNTLLTDPVYLSGWRHFRGVKVALLAPPVLVLLHALFQQLLAGLRLADLRRLSLRRLFISGGGLAIGAVYVWRSGNEVSTISGLEQMLRLNLEAIFGARPRFKEFLIGHPATMLLGWPAVKRWHELGLGLLIFASIAQASLFNTFMHLHAPILLSLRRSLWGLALGEIIGFAALAVFVRLKLEEKF